MQGGEYGNYDYSKKDIYFHIENAAINASLDNNFDVVIDRTNMDKTRRARFIELAQNKKAIIDCYDFGVGDKKRCLENRMKESRGISFEKWSAVWDKMAEAYEKPSKKEGIINILTTNIL